MWQCFNACGHVGDDVVKTEHQNKEERWFKRPECWTIVGARQAGLRISKPAELLFSHTTICKVYRELSQIKKKILLVSSSLSRGLLQDVRGAWPEGSKWEKGNSFTCYSQGLQRARSEMRNLEADDLTIFFNGYTKQPKKWSVSLEVNSTLRRQTSRG